MNALSEWWEQASPRDQLMLVVGGIFVGLYILFMVVLQPVSEMRDQEAIKNNALKSSLENVRRLAAKVSASTETEAEEGGKSTIETIVQRSVASNGLQVSSMSASGNEGVRLRFEEARFDAILKWLYEMEVTQQLRVKDVSVAPSDGPGLVTVNLRLNKE